LQVQRSEKNVRLKMLRPLFGLLWQQEAGSTTDELIFARFFLLSI